MSDYTTKDLREKYGVVSVKVIVINTDRTLLGEAACETFGRFFIALLVQATQQRASDKPVYCYIDEAHDYIAADEKIAELLDKARDQKVGFILAHQRLQQIRSANVLDALSNVPIKFAGGTDTDHKILAGYMRTTPEFIRDQPELSFAAFIRNQTAQAVQVTLKHGVMEAMDRMDPREWKEVQEQMWRDYCDAPNDASPSPPSSPPSPTRPARGSVTDVDYQEIDPRTKAIEGSKDEVL